MVFSWTIKDFHDNNSTIKVRYSKELEELKYLKNSIVKMKI